MKCRKCGFSLPEDSEFCQYCGTHCELLSTLYTETNEVAAQEEIIPPTEYEVVSEAVVVESSRLEPTQQGSPKTVSASTVHPAVSTPKGAPINLNEKKYSYCKKCGSAIDSNTKKCSGCGKQYFHAKTIVPVIVFSLLLIASIGLNIMQYYQRKEAIETVTTQSAKIELLEKEISKQQSTISSQKTQIASLEKKGNYFNVICKTLSAGNVGYAASNFNASESVIVVDKNKTDRKITLTANWPSSGTVSADYSGSSAWIEFDNDSWRTSTTLTIKPMREGVTVVTFSNDVDSKTFKIVIIVT